MLDDLEILEMQECIEEVKTNWGSQGQPVFPSNNHTMVSENFKFFLDHLAFGSEEASRLGGLRAKESYYNTLSQEDRIKVASEIARCNLHNIKL